MFIKEDQFLNASVVAMETMRDPVFGKVLQFTQQGWPNNLEDLNSLMKMVSSRGTPELLYQSRYRLSYWPICKQNTWVWAK